MIGEFLESWELFGHSYLAAWLLAITLSAAGVVVVTRNQIFLGAAVAQASTAGVALGLWAPIVLGLSDDSFLAGHVAHSLWAVATAIVAAVLADAGAASLRQSREAFIGWIFLASAALAVLLVAPSPHGMEEVQRLIISSLIGATEFDAWMCGALALALGATLIVLRRPLLAFIMDPALAQSLGMNLRLWSTITAAALGLILGLSLHTAGLLFTFGLLVLPAMIAKNLCREVGRLFLIAPLVGVAVSVIASVLAHHFDLPPGQFTVALLAALLPVTGVARRKWIA